MRELFLFAGLFCAAQGGLLAPDDVAVYHAYSQSWEFVLTLAGETNE